MKLKRPRDVFDTPSSSSPPYPPSKRQSLQSERPTPTPRLPLPLPSPWAAIVAHDSPSNPFGDNRGLKALALPRVTGFNRHVVLRFQLVSQIEDRSRTRRVALPQGPSRIVQIPLTYSFRLLHELILFLFASDARLQVRRRRRVFSPASLIPHQPPPPTRKRQLEVFGESPTKEEGHLFEVINDVSVYPLSQRPGVIKTGSGKLYAKLSSARERKPFSRIREDYDDDEAEDVFAPAPRKPLANLENADEDEWDWEGEDDFILANIWTDGPDFSKGIIYHHTRSTAIHISVNQTRVPPRKGSGNTPYIFSARGGTNGAVRIANIINGPMPSDEEIKENIEVKKSSSRRSKDKKKVNNPLFDFSVEEFFEVDDLDDGEDADEDVLQRWNDFDAFQRFLQREAARERAMRRRTVEPESPVPTPGPSQRRANILGPVRPQAYAHAGLARPPRPSFYARSRAASTSASSTSSHSASLSSPSTLPVLLPSSDFDADASDASSGVYAPLALPAQTPFPAHPGVRRRVARHCKRIERQTSKALSEMGDSDEEVTQKAKVLVAPAKPAQPQKAEDVTVKAAAPVVAAKGPCVYVEDEERGCDDDDDADWWEDDVDCPEFVEEPFSDDEL